jgi:hypothetical protein
MKTINHARLIIGVLVASSLGTMLALNSGCIAVVAGAAAGAGTVAFVEGKFIGHIGYPYERVVAATKAAIPQDGLAMIEENHDALATEFTARTGNDTKVDIEVTRESDNLAKVEIRVGTFGDKQASAAIYDKIQANL